MKQKSIRLAALLLCVAALSCTSKSGQRVPKKATQKVRVHELLIDDSIGFMGLAVNVMAMDLDTSYRAGDTVLISAGQFDQYYVIDKQQ